MRKCLRFVFLGLIFLNLGCKDDNQFIVPPSANNPSVKPAVIFTYPGNNTTGPFTVYSVQNTSRYHFFVQFNKLIDVMSLSGNVSCDGFDFPVIVEHQYVYGNQFTDIVNFEIYEVMTTGYRKAKFEFGKTYTITLNNAITDIHGYALERYSFTFTPEPSFRVIKGNPTGDITSDYFSYPVIYFNSKVTLSVASAVSITPTLAGSWSLSSDSLSITFMPTGGIPVNIAHTVTVSRDAQDVDGNRIGTPYTFSFKRINQFKLYYIQVSTGDDGVQSSINFQFSTDVDSLSVPGAIAITPPVTGRYKYSGSMVTFVADSALIPSQTYTVQISSALKSRIGDNLAAQQYNLYTSEFMVSMMFPNQYGGLASKHTSIELRSNYLLDTASARQAFSISPAVIGEFIAYRNYMIFDPDAMLSPNTLYTVNVSTSLKTVNGKALSYNRSFTFKTGE